MSVSGILSRFFPSFGNLRLRAAPVNIPSVAISPSDICGQRQPCVNKTPAQRVKMGCVATVGSSTLWSGKWESRTVCDPFKGGRGPSVCDGLRFYSNRHSECEIADLLWGAVDKFETIRGHVNDAKMQYRDHRLSGLRDRTWLMLGSSIDHRVTRFLCPLFGQRKMLFPEFDGVQLGGGFLCYSLF